MKSIAQGLLLVLFFLLGMSSEARAAVTQLKFMNAPLSASANQCSGAVKVERVDTWGNAQAVSSTTTVNLAAQGAALYSDAGCTTPVSSMLIGTWGYFVTFYYKGSVVGSPSITASASGLIAASQNESVTSGAPAKVLFSSQPSAQVVAGSAFAPGKVSIVDAGGNLVTGSSAPVSIALVGGSGLAGTLSQNAVGGVATFSNLALNAAGSGYSLAASSTGLAGASSQSFSVAAGPAVSLAFSSQPPSSVSAGAPFGAQVSAYDAYGNLAKGFSGAVGLAASASSLGGTVSQSAVGGIASFSNLSLNSAGAYSLVASSAGLPNVSSQSFSMQPGAPASLAFSAQPPSQAVAGAAFAPAIKVSIYDAYGNLVSGASNVVSIALAAPAVGSLGGTLSQAASGGVAVFSNLSMSAAGAGYSLVASSAGLSSAASSSFAVQAGAPASLAFSSQPPAQAVAGQAISPAPSVAVFDAYGNPVSSSALSISVALGNNPSAATLSGTLSRAAVASVASFDDLKLGNVGSGYTLVASAVGVSGATSQGFNVQSGPAAALAFVSQPAASAA
ncbi:MAG: hypothetical protein HY075_15145, partial [Deltaproteobacteria bacterium]|nr:hypothetical protein [Deltaproteobacteria bacterium]